MVYHKGDCDEFRILGKAVAYLHDLEWLCSGVDTRVIKNRFQQGFMRGACNMLTLKEMDAKIKLQKSTNAEAETQFHGWYGSLSSAVKEQFDQDHKRK